MRPFILFLLLTAGGTSASPFSFKNLMRRDLHARLLIERTPETIKSSKVLLNFKNDKRDRNLLGNAAAQQVQPLSFGNAFPGDAANEADIIPVTANHANANGVSCQASNGGSASSSSSSGGTCQQGSGGNTQTLPATGDNNGFGSGLDTSIGSDVCGNGGCKSQAEYCAAIAQNRKTDPKCTGQTSSNGTYPTTGSNSVNNGTQENNDFSTGGNNVGSDVCGNGGCKSEADYCAAIVRNGQTDPKCSTQGTELRSNTTGSNTSGENGSTSTNTGTGGCNKEKGGDNTPQCNGGSQSSRMMRRQNQQSNGGDYLSYVNEWRQKFCLAPFQKNAAMEENARYQAGLNGGDPKSSMSEDPCPGTAQVTAGGTGPDSIKLTMDIWGCEVRTENVDGCTCSQAWQEYGYSGRVVNGSPDRGHFDLLVGPQAAQYSQIGCAYVPHQGSPTAGTPASLKGLWVCTLGQSAGYTNCKGGQSSPGGQCDETCQRKKRALIDR